MYVGVGGECVCVRACVNVCAYACVCVSVYVCGGGGVCVTLIMPTIIKQGTDTG